MEYPALPMDALGCGGVQINHVINHCHDGSACV